MSVQILTQSLRGSSRWTSVQFPLGERGRASRNGLLNLLTGQSDVHKLAAFPKLSPLDQQAHSLALFRYARVVGDLARDGEYRDVWNEVRRSAGFWVLMLRARADLSEALRDRADHPATALALVLHDDMADAAATIQRDRETMQRIKGVD